MAHQTNMTNLITRTGWEARLAAASPSQDASARVTEAARDLVDYMLFVDEAPLTGPVKGGSGFAESFGARGPRDGQGRSLRDFDLRRRLFKYPCSYMIYTPAFDALPPAAKNAVYTRLWEVLSGRETQPRYRSLTPQDRQAIVSILRETKRDLRLFQAGDVIPSPGGRASPGSACAKVDPTCGSSSSHLVALACAIAVAHLPRSPKHALIRDAASGRCGSPDQGGNGRRLRVAATRRIDRYIWRSSERLVESESSHSVVGSDDESRRPGERARSSRSPCRDGSVAASRRRSSTRRITTWRSSGSAERCQRRPVVSKRICWWSAASTISAARASEARGKIVLFDVMYGGYAETVTYRNGGARAAAQQGAAAVLVRSIGPIGLADDSHRQRELRAGSTAIPAAAIAAEDANRLVRLARSGRRVRLRLLLEGQREADVESANVVGEIVGREKPNEIVLLGGHLDSWDVGTGASDDGVGCIITWEAARLMSEARHTAPSHRSRGAVDERGERTARRGRVRGALRVPQPRITCSRSNRISECSRRRRWDSPAAWRHEP